VGNRYSDEWHVQHLVNPRDVVPESIMPAYPFLKGRDLDVRDIAGHLKANRMVGVPYSDEAIANALADMLAQANPEADTEGLLKRYPKAQARDFDGDPTRLTEMDALVAYLQMLGTLVDFDSYVPEQNRR
ncbi:MAG: cbb3-type cytochrome c oxidase subunit II, partial [Sandaracinobacteroides sp.]